MIDWKQVWESLDNGVANGDGHWLITADSYEVAQDLIEKCSYCENFDWPEVAQAVHAWQTRQLITWR